MDVIHDYFLRSFESQQFLRGNASYEPSSWTPMLEAKLIVSGDEIPVAAAITDLSMVEARAVLTALSQKPERSVSSNHRLIETIRQADETAVKSAVADARDWTSVYFVTPPPMMTWSDFQSLRQQVKGMAVALGDLYADIIRRKYPLDHIKLTRQ